MIHNNKDAKSKMTNSIAKNKKAQTPAKANAKTKMSVHKNAQ